MSIHKYIEIVASIFFDPPESRLKGAEDIYNPQDLTKHYLSEYPGFSLDGVYVATQYHDVMESMEAYKYRSDRQYGDLYVDLLTKICRQYIVASNDVAIMSVPMHWSRYMIRGFNHIDFLVSRLSGMVDIPQMAPLRANWTRRQSKLSKSKRIQNRESAFVLKPGILLPKNIIIIDDVVSTGSTLDACAKVLKSVGVERVYGVCIASNQ